MPQPSDQTKTSIEEDCKLRAHALFQTPELLQEAIDKYIKSPPTKTITTDSGTYERPYLTISGLAYQLGFESRQSFYDYENRVGFSYTIKRARLFIEDYYESNLTNQSCTGSIFALKNMGWKSEAQDDDPNRAAPDLNITFAVADAKQEVVVTKGE